MTTIYSLTIIDNFQVKIPLESSKDTRDYKDNVLDGNTNGIGGSGIEKNASNDKAESKLLANPKAARISIDVQINH